VGRTKSKIDQGPAGAERVSGQLPPLIVLIVGKTGRTIRRVRMEDPREAYCRHFNGLAGEGRAVPLRR